MYQSRHRSRIRRLALYAAAAVVTAFAATASGVALAPSASAFAFDYTHLTKIQHRILSGFADLELNPAAATVHPAHAARNPHRATQPACPGNLGRDMKVNTDCLNLSDPDLSGRGQAQNETTIAADPVHLGDLIAMSNDYRTGDSTCFPAFSTDNGASWTDVALPDGFARGTAFGSVRQYWQNCGDPFVLGYDTFGNAYVGALSFNRGTPLTSNPDMSSAIYVWRSTADHGASYDFPARPVFESPNLTGSPAAAFEDKPYGTVDNHRDSPFANRLYVTWTEFAADGTAYIWEASSADFGEHFGPRNLVSAATPDCANTFGLPTPNGPCNENQFSQPFTGADGALYVVYDNYNNATASPNDNHNQVLMAKSTDGGSTFTVSKVGDFFDLPDCATYQQGLDAGRACVPEKGSTANSYFRASDYPVAAVDPTDPAHIAVTFGSYINPHSNEANGCVPMGVNPATGQNLYTGVKTPGACRNSILISTSTDGGAGFTGTTTDPRSLAEATGAPQQTTSDQFMQWAAYSTSGTLTLAYYDRHYGDDETTGFSDISLSGSADLTRFAVARATGTSMPPPTQFRGLFIGDYTGLAAARTAHPVWTDTRAVDLFLCPGTGTTTAPPAVCTAGATNAALANDENIYTTTLDISPR